VCCVLCACVFGVGEQDSIADLLVYQELLLEEDQQGLEPLADRFYELVEQIDEHTKGSTGVGIRKDKASRMTCLEMVTEVDFKFNLSHRDRKDAHGKQIKRQVTAYMLPESPRHPKLQHAFAPGRRGSLTTPDLVSEIQNAGSARSLFEQKETRRDIVRRQREKFKGAARAWMRTFVCDEASAATPGETELVAKMKEEEPNAETAWLAWIADEHRRCYAFFAEVLTAVAERFEKGHDDAEACHDAARLIDNAHYVLCARAMPMMVTNNSGNGEGCRDRDRSGETLEDFLTMHEAEACNLTLVEVAALRLYTTSTFKLINDPLRSSREKTVQQLHESKHPLAITTYHITTGLKKLRALNLSSIESISDYPMYLWRGLKNRVVSSHFMARGGAEIACMSTSESLETVADYAQSDAPLLFRIKVESPMDRGASIRWLSIYPDEDEVLYPPLMYLQPLLKQKIRGHEGNVITLKVVYPC